MLVNVYPSTGHGSNGSQSRTCPLFSERRSETVNVPLNILNITCLCIVFIFQVLPTALSFSKFMALALLRNRSMNVFLISPKSLLY